MSERSAIIFLETEYNRNSVAALAGSLEDILGELSGTVKISFLPVEYLGEDIRLTEAIGDAGTVMFAASLGILYDNPGAFLADPKSPALEGRRIYHVAGGPGAVNAPELLLYAGFDAVCASEGEEVIRDLARFIGLGRFRRFWDIPGLWVMERKNAYFTGRRPRVDLSNYRPCSRRWRKFGFIEIVRGCLNGCIFCQTPRFFRGGVRERSLRVVYGSVRDFVKGGRDHVRLLAPNALSYGSHLRGQPNLSALERLLSGIRANLPDTGMLIYGTFPSEIRPEWVTVDAVRLLKKYVSNRKVAIGAQTGSDTLLKKIRRGHTTNDTLRAVRICREEGLKVFVDMIFGLPHETPSEFEESKRFMYEIFRLGGVVNAHTFIPLPGTPLANVPAQKLRARFRRELSTLEAGGQIIGNWRDQAAFRKWRVKS
ncbi:MAG: TIGR04013 family B12-binding domain/radical SAM domain-containing protein [Planctomycetota bacterium]|nr:MAG: TIGR04013 family B12-binding domain/radical SAM domain-containing protein [Planctomycetota bacterium]